MLPQYPQSWLQPELDENGIPIGTQQPAAAPAVDISAFNEVVAPTAPPVPQAVEQAQVAPPVESTASAIEGASDQANMDTAHTLGNEVVAASNPMRGTKYGREFERQAAHLVDAGSTKSRMQAVEGEADLRAAGAVAESSAAAEQIARQAAEEGERERQKRIAMREDHARQFNARIDAALREPNPGRF